MNYSHMTAKVLYRAAEIVEQGPWVQYSGLVIDGTETEVCALGALQRAAHELRWSYAPARAVFLFAHRAESVSLLNDEPGRTQTEVADALRAAASLSERSDA